MTLEQLEKFCGSYGFLTKPFAVDKWRVASDGHILIAENGISPIKLPELEHGRNRETIIDLISVKIADARY